MFKIICHLFPLLFYFLSEMNGFALGTRITLYTESYHTGDKLRLDINIPERPCINIPPPFYKNVSSVKIISLACVAFHTGPNCTGENLEIPGETSPHLDSLQRWNFDNKAASMSLCRDRCDPETTGTPPNPPEESFPVTIYALKMFRGKALQLNVSGCTLIPRKYVGRVRSIDTYGTCFELYNEPSCSDYGIFRNSVELRPYVPDFSDLYSWGSWVHHEARAIGHCHYKCDRERYAHLEEERLQPNLTRPNRVTVYDWVDYKGNWLTKKITKCFNFPSSWFNNFDSVSVHGGCVTIFTEFNCNGSSINLDRDYPNLESFNHRAQGHYNHFLPRDRKDTSMKSARVCLDYEEGLDPKTGEMEDGGDVDEFEPERINLLKEEEEALITSPFYLAFWIILLMLFIGGVSFRFGLVSKTRKKHKISKQAAKPQLSEQEVKEFMDGLQPPLNYCVIDKQNNNEKREDKDYDEEDTGVANSEVDEEVGGNYQTAPSPDGVMSEDEAIALPFDKSKEVAFGDFIFDWRNPLGKGEFGVVYKGRLYRNNGGKGLDESVSFTTKASSLTEVAVKVNSTEKTDTTLANLRSIMKEVKVMMYVGKHERLVEMLGCCTEKLLDGQIFILMEYCEKGSLEKYLHQNKGIFKNIVEKGRLLEQDEIGELSGYQIGPKTGDDEEEKTEPFDFYRLVRWCVEIAEGMEYLGKKKVIHGDLATRNVLLGKGLEAKISDFGLSRRLYYYTEYIKKNQEPLPWRWLAPETLKNMEFTPKSDVWSFGVTLWEIFTLGEIPFAGVAWGQEFIQNLSDGLRLRKPVFCTTEIYNVMMDCWEEDPNRRPTFAEVLKEIMPFVAPGFV